jgi:hypothetical protein
VDGFRLARERVKQRAVVNNVMNLQFYKGQVISRRWLSSGLLRSVVWKKFTDVSEVLAAFIIRA